MRHSVLPSPLHTPVVTPDFDNFVGQSTPMRHFYAMVRAASCAPCPVLISGESGTGKTLAAHSLHHHSPRAAKPFVVLDCATVAPDSLDSILFGYRHDNGLAAQADGGTLFLEDITALPPQMQLKLLHMIDSGRYRRSGDTAESHADLRIITSTRDHGPDGHRPLREDLFHRLTALHLNLPPLRQRGDADIIRLSHHFIAREVERSGRQPPLPDEQAQAWLCAQAWTGNVRELANCLRHALVFFPDEHILTPYHLQPPVQRAV